MTFLKTKTGIFITILIAVFVFLYFFTGVFGNTRLGITINTNPDLENGLVGHWTFDGPTMVDAVGDSSVYNNHGYLSSGMSTTTLPGKMGQSLSFDGVNDYFSFVSSTELENLDPFTVCFWLNPQDNGETYPAIVGNQDGLEGWDVYLIRNGGNPFGLGTSYRRSSDNNYVYKEETGQVVLLNIWSHVCASQNGTNPSGMNLYVNGLLSTVSIDTSGSGARADDGANDYEIGIYSDLTDDFLGELDDIRIYNRELSSGEILRLYQLGATTKIAKTVTTNPDLKNGLVGHWTFDGSDLKDNAADRSGNNNTGYLVGFTSTTTIGGKIGQGLLFDGVDDYVDTPDYNPNNTDFTIAAWVSLDGTGSHWYPIFGNNQGTPMLGYYPAGSDFFGTWVQDGTGSESFTWDVSNFDGFGLAHVALVSRDAVDNEVEFFFNGESLGSEALTKSYSHTNGEFRWLGRDFSNFWEGIIDDARLYDRALSSAEVKRLYQLGATTKIAKTVTTNPDLENGLVGHYTFDGNLANEITDRSGSGNTGYFSTTSQATSTMVRSGKIGQAIEFDGVDDYVEVKSASVTEAPLSMCAWSKIDTYPSVWGESYTIMGIHNYPFSSWFGMFINDGTDKARYQVRLDNQNVFWLDASSTVPLGEWVHNCVVSYSTTSHSLYVNGLVEIASTTASVAPFVNEFVVGGIHFNGGKIANIHGEVDDARFYDRALTDAEILRLYQLGGGN